MYDLYNLDYNELRDAIDKANALAEKLQSQLNVVAPKSEIIRKYCKEHGIPLKNIHAECMDSCDLEGLPNV